MRLRDTVLFQSPKVNISLTNVWRYSKWMSLNTFRSSSQKLISDIHISDRGDGEGNMLVSAFSSSRSVVQYMRLFRACWKAGLINKLCTSAKPLAYQQGYTDSVESVSPKLPSSDTMSFSVSFVLSFRISWRKLRRSGLLNQTYQALQYISRIFLRLVNYLGKITSFEGICNVMKWWQLVTKRDTLQRHLHNKNSVVCVL